VMPAEVAAYGEAVRDYYRRFDGVLARIVAAIGDEATVLVISDPGFHAAEEHQRTVSAEGLLRLVGESEHFHGQAINERAFLLHRTPTAPSVRVDVERTAAKLRALRHRGAPLVQVEITEPHALTVRLDDRPFDLKGTVETETGTEPLESVITVTTW